MSAGEDELEFQLRAAKISYEREFRWEPTRRWRADFKVGDFLVEVEGGAWNGGHRRGAEADKDCERHNHAVLAGFRPLRFTPAMVETGEAIEMICAALGRELP